MAQRITGRLAAACGAIATLVVGSEWMAVAQDQVGQEAPPSPALHYYVPPPTKPDRQDVEVDLCVYGGTAAGVMAAVQATRDGWTVVMVAPDAHLGGMSSSGLSYTDTGNRLCIGGMAMEFYRRVGTKYGVNQPVWDFEPRIAEQVFEEMAAEARVPIYYRHFVKQVSKRNGRIETLTTERGLTVKSRLFLDATYEGDLMAKAGVAYAVGRESSQTYGETFNGVQFRDKHQFEFPVSPFVTPNVPGSGLLPGIQPGPIARNGSGDRSVQAYNFRMTLTRDTANRVPFPKPNGYDASDYELLARYLEAGWTEPFKLYNEIRGGKADFNNYGAVSTDFVGMNHAYPDADYPARERIYQAHVRYQQGLMWYLTHEARVPEAVRTRLSQWGLCRDEFPDTSGWPHQLYVREARRMVADYVMIEANCRGKRVAPDSVGLGSYALDSHNCRRFSQDGRVWNEGDVQVFGVTPYPISYRSIVPKRKDCSNLFVPVCLSASHIAYGSIRMEPVYMILGQAAGVAASDALLNEKAVQDVSMDYLQSRLRQLGQVLTPPQTMPAVNGSNDFG